MKHVGPVMSSESSLNHFTVNGAVPLKELLKRTVELGRAAWDSGRAVKLGGSEGNETEQGEDTVIFWLRIK